MRREERKKSIEVLERDVFVKRDFLSILICWF